MHVTAKLQIVYWKKTFQFENASVAHVKENSYHLKGFNGRSTGLIIVVMLIEISYFLLDY